MHIGEILSAQIGAVLNRRAIDHPRRRAVAPHDAMPCRRGRMDRDWLQWPAGKEDIGKIAGAAPAADRKKTLKTTEW